MKQTLQDDQEKMLKYIQIRYLQALMNEKKKKKKEKYGTMSLRASKFIRALVLI